MGDRIRFVDSILASPGVRLDLNDETKWAVRGRDFSPPALRRTESRTMLADGAHVGQSAYDNRILKLTLELVESSQDNLATETQKLVRELDRETNILEYRPTGATHSVFFRTFRVSPQEIQDLIAAAAIRDHVIEVLAEPFGLGLREDLGTFYVSNAPDATTNLVPNPSLEVNTTGWVAHANCSIARTTVQFWAGSAALQMTATAAADMTACTSRGTSGIAATVGTSYTAQARFRTAVTGRSCRVNIAWFDAAGALLSTSTGSTVTDTTTGWTVASVTATAPASTAFAALEATVVAAAAAEVHYVDAAQLAAENYRSAYIDGSFGGRWTGTAHQSTSIRNRLSLDLTGIKGDVETPLVIEYADITQYPGFVGPPWNTAPGLVVAVRSGASPYPTLARQCESMTQGNDTSAVADAKFSGGSKSRCTFATIPTSTSRVAGYAPEATFGPHGAHVIGTYRVFARVQKTVSGDDIRMKIAPTFNQVFQPEITLPSGTKPILVDLGLYFVHGANPRSPGYSPTRFRSEVLPQIEIHARRVTGTGNLDLDYVAFLPADTVIGMWTKVAAGGNAANPVGLVDGPNDQIYGAMDPFGATPGFEDSIIYTPIGVSGGTPFLEPGDSRLVLAVVDPMFTDTAFFNDITTALKVTCRYWPRYLYVRPSAT